jgi:hypothetical protein
MKACRAFDPGSNPGPGVDLQVRKGDLARVLVFLFLLSTFPYVFRGFVAMLEDMFLPGSSLSYRRQEMGASSLPQTRGLLAGRASCLSEGMREGQRTFVMALNH